MMFRAQAQTDRQRVSYFKPRKNITVLSLNESVIYKSVMDDMLSGYEVLWKQNEEANKT